MIGLIEKMCDEGLLDKNRAAFVMDKISCDGECLERALLSESSITEEQVLRFLSRELNYPFIDLSKCAPSKEFLSQFPARILLKRQILPLKNEDGSLVAVTSLISDMAGMDELRLATGMDFSPALAPAEKILGCIKSCLGVGADTVQSLVTEVGDNGLQILNQEMEDDMDLESAAEGASIIRFVNQILIEAIQLRATDVHIEPFENELRIRYRIDGVLKEVSIPPDVGRFQAAIVSRIKILSHLDIAEKRLPQDGRIKIKIENVEVDVRVSVIPMLHGEAIVLRLLSRSSVLLGLEQLGMGSDDFKIFSRLLELPYGIILVTGPTGSGKTTTLYAALSQINDVERKIITIEDPVEYHLRGINQIQVSTKAGLTFANGLRSILRHDPDVILIGEIRDRETAEIAVQASLTGHLVFSTLHTNDAPGALTRLVDMGIEPYLVASTLEGVIAQRLVRMICPDCAEEYTPTNIDRLKKELGDAMPERLRKGKGCPRCNGMGFVGRKGIFEQMVVTKELRHAITEGASHAAVREMALKNGMKTLREDGIRYVAEGRTTIEELIRLTKDERFNGNGNGAS
jgi:general secretion pathway protein E